MRMEDDDKPSTKYSYYPVSVYQEVITDSDILWVMSAFCRTSEANLVKFRYLFILCIRTHSS